MKAAEDRWSRHVWWWGFVFLFLTHAFAIFWLAERKNVTPSWQKPSAFLHLSGEPEMDARLVKTSVLRDPTLFALPHAQSFSGGAWLNFQPRTPPLSNWTAPPEWLSLPMEQLGQTLDDYVATNRPSEEHLLASLRTTTPPDVRIPDQPVLSNSTVTVEGALASRKLEFAPPLPNVPHGDVLAKTVITISVNGDGVVESAAVAKESGSRWADERGLQLARAFAFEPAVMRDASPTFGRVAFTWNVQPPTNAIPATANTTERVNDL